MDNIVTKVCSKCGKRKLPQEMKKDKKRKDGLSSWCSECQKESVHKSTSKWYAENHEEILSRKREQRATNPESIREQRRRYKELHPEKIQERNKKYRETYGEKAREAVRQWSLKNLDKVRLYVNNRRARKNFNGGEITTKEWNDLLDKYRHKCLCCGRDDVPMTLDHVIPLSLGGKNVIANAQCLCRSCNSKKSARHIDYRK